MLSQAARNTDPITSHIAAEETETSGRRAVQMMKAVEAVKQYPGHTSAELARVTGLDCTMLARRLPDARELNFIKNGADHRKCEVTGNKCLTWYEN